MFRDGNHPGSLALKAASINKRSNLHRSMRLDPCACTPRSAGLHARRCAVGRDLRTFMEGAFSSDRPEQAFIASIRGVMGNASISRDQ
jgi:hypothetical protein